MDTRSEIREFLISRRSRIKPEQAGLRTYGGNRRVPRLRREEVALLAGVSVDYYTRLERGNAPQGSPKPSWRRSPVRFSSTRPSERISSISHERCKRRFGRVAARRGGGSGRACSASSTR